MTEAEWLAATNPTPMLEFVGGKASDRKLRLIAVACCRRVWDLITNGTAQNAVEVSERYAEKMASPLERREAALAAWQLLKGHGECVTASYFATGAAAVCTGLPAQRAASAVCGNVQNAVSFAAAANQPPGCTDPCKPRREEERVHSDFMRCIFGNPFRTVTAEPAWLTSAVVSLATGIYTEKSFDRLPILADAIEEAGCSNEDILTHLRSDGPHVRGCWALDLILGKS